MRPKARQEAAPAPARVEFQVRFEPRPKGRRRNGRDWGEAPSTPAPEVPSAISEGSTAADPAPHRVPPDVPKITKLLVVAYWWERLIDEGNVKNYAEIARRTGLSRARVTQIENLTMFAPSIQNGMLTARRESRSERSFRGLMTPLSWSRRRRG